MAKILQAVAKYGPRIELKPTIGSRDVADRVADLDLEDQPQEAVK